jgi:primosomal protein N'
MTVLRKRRIATIVIAVYDVIPVPRWKKGDKVWVPWGYQGDRPGVVIGFTSQRVRVMLQPDGKNPVRPTVVAAQTLRKRK